MVSSCSVDSSKCFKLQPSIVLCLSRSRKLWRSNTASVVSASRWQSASIDLQEGSDFKVCFCVFVPLSELNIRGTFATILSLRCCSFRIQDYLSIDRIISAYLRLHLPLSRSCSSSSRRDAGGELLNYNW